MGFYVFGVFFMPFSLSGTVPSGSATIRFTHHPGPSQVTQMLRNIAAGLLFMPGMQRARLVKPAFATHTVANCAVEGAREVSQPP